MHLKILKLCNFILDNFFETVESACRKNKHLLWTFFFVAKNSHIYKFFALLFPSLAYCMIPCFVSRFCKNCWRHIFYLDDPCNLCHSEFSSVVGNVILILVMAGRQKKVSTPCIEKPKLGKSLVFFFW